MKPLLEIGVSGMSRSEWEPWTFICRKTHYCLATVIVSCWFFFGPIQWRTFQITFPTLLNLCRNVVGSRLSKWAKNPLQASRHLSEPQFGLAPSPSQLPCLHIVQGLSKRLLIVSQAVVQQGLIMVPGRSRSAPQLTVVGFLLQV